MAEVEDAEPEGWDVPFGLGAICAFAVPLALGAATLAAAIGYDRALRPELAFSVAPQPAPALEVTVHPGGMDPETPEHADHRDPRIERAKAELVKEGISGWNEP